jgi:glycosyltransferase involved in cell wall biosynthesis
MIMVKNEIKNALVSVIICAFSTKRFDMTVDCIYSIFESTYTNYEIILVIDGNEQLKYSLSDRFKDIDKVTVIGNKKDGGPSMARNHGIEIANGDILAFIDDDAYVTTEWLERIAKDFSERSDIAVVGGKLLPIYNYSCNKKLPEELLWIVGCTYKGHTECRQFVRNVISANMAARRSIFGHINFKFMHTGKNRLFVPIKQLEDTLFCIMVNKRKVDTILYDPDIIVYHNVPTERLKLSYIIKRSFSEGILKAQLEYIDHKDGGKDKVLYYEQNYLNKLLISIMRNFYTFKIRDNLLLSITIICVLLGYMSETILLFIEEKAEKAKGKKQKERFFYGY